MNDSSKRTAPEAIEYSSTERKRIRPDGPSISNLLADIQAEFRRREDEKDQSFTKWEQEGR
jgi:hypothetical protein